MASRDRDSANFFLKQQVSFDRRVTDLRRWYESLSAEDRRAARAVFEKLAVLAQEADAFRIELRAVSRLDVFDDDGELQGWVDSEFTPQTVLSALDAWDRGEPFAPSTVRA